MTVGEIALETCIANKDPSGISQNSGTLKFLNFVFQ